MMELEDRLRLARFVLGSLREMPVSAVRLLAAGLALSGGLVGRFSSAFDYYADVLEFPAVTSKLAVRKLAFDLHRAAFDPVGCDGLIERLDGVEAAPWPQLRTALVAVRDSHDAISLSKNERK